MEQVQNAITLLKAQPRAIRVWCAVYFLEVLPDMDATESKSWEQLATDTGMPNEMAKCIVRGWLFDMEHEIDEMLKTWK